MSQLRLLLVLTSLVVIQCSAGLVDVKEEWPKCLKRVRPPKNMEKAMMLCKPETEEKLAETFSDITSVNITTELFDDIKSEYENLLTSCLIEKLNYADAQGNLNATRLIADINATESKDPMMMDTFKILAISCAKTNTTGSNATEQFGQWWNCLLDSGNNFCEKKKELMETYLDRDPSSSRCANVTTPEDFRQIRNELKAGCVSSSQAKETSSDGSRVGPSVPGRGQGGGRGRGQGRGRGRGGQGRGSRGNNRRFKRQTRRDRPSTGGNRRGGRGGGGRGSKGDRGSRPGGRKERELVAQNIEMCVLEGLGVIKDEVFDFEALAEILDTFNDSGAGILDEVKLEVTNCASNLTGNPQMQHLEWQMCAIPTVVDICGFGTNVTVAIFPLLEDNLLKFFASKLQKKIGLEIPLEENSL